MRKRMQTGLKALPVFIGALLFGGCGDSATVAVVEGQLVQQVEVTGVLTSADTLSMMPPAMRRVWQYQVKSLAPEGKEVKQGSVVARLDTSELNQRLQVKSAELEATVQDIETSRLRNAKKLEELKLELAEARMEEEKALRKFELSDETVAAIDKEKYQRDAIIATEKVALIERKFMLEQESIKGRMAMLDGDRQKFAAEVAALKQGIAAMSLKAPRDGMVVYGTDPQGNKIKEGQSVFAGDAVFSMPDLDRMQVAMAIPEVEANRVRAGLRVKIRLDANPERVFHGTLSETGAVFRRKNDDIPLVVFDAVARFDEVDKELMRPGMTAKINIDVVQDKSALLLPLDAVHYEEGRPFVWQSGLLGDSRQFVALGDSGRDRVVVLSGLALGDEVILK
ncbi:efflux RND transporter periplasmic adaptor subunit [Shewanella litorisediminis]|uniref:HlyD family efflux transporter periplasmic adaptor subunit n=1 Tax=Shewanella litorisediminis TaxID=1173586 RepID=A0ABX7G7M3_9GAMM|nr:HlyD family efflux transporter periplasmic adaptor subunit [Shewanella litorisediminis]MCL2916637.1 efflux RND transporter periplasmic adaptor subunit [Shewanella litorisediminis]QRH03185.1 HlyD family efflux transporter periplasmic adaptor subunit [Shewanella litorisediminis]